MKKLTVDEIQKMKKLFYTGEYTLYQIAQKIGCTQATVSYHISKILKSKTKS